MKKINIGIKIDLDKLLETRLLIQAGSGGGKSGAIRKLLEEVSGKVQVIALDIEGELVTIREKYDFALIGKEGDIPLSVRYADILALKLLETNISAVIDLYELKHNERIEFVKKFLESMINAPKNLWHDCIIVIDEAHLFCSEKNKEESKLAVIDLLTRGRKRGFAGVLATQRLSKLNKDAAAECYNKLIGKTGLDIDQKRAGEELGFTSKEEFRNLRNLKRQEFYAFGNAISDEVKFFRVDDCKTKFPERGKVLTTPPTPGAIKKILSKLEDIPKEAELEIKTKADLENKVHSLNQEIRKLQSDTISTDKIAEIQKQANENALIETAKLYKPVLDNFKDKVKAEILKRDNEINRLKIHIERSKDFISGFNFVDIPIFEIPNLVVNEQLASSNTVTAINIPNVQKITKPVRYVTKNVPEDTNVLGKTERAILTVLANRLNMETSKVQISIMSGYSIKSSGLVTAIGKLISYDLIRGNHNNYYITQEGLNQLGDYEALPQGQELRNYWYGKLDKCERKILEYLCGIYPMIATRLAISQDSKYSLTSSGFVTAIGKLKTLELITGKIDSLKASENLF